MELEREVVATATCVDQLTLGLLDFRSPPLAAMTNLRTAVAITRTKINLLRDRALTQVETASDVTIQEQNLRAGLNVVLCQVDVLGKQTLAPRLYAGDSPGSTMFARTSTSRSGASTRGGSVSSGRSRETPMLRMSARYGSRWPMLSMVFVRRTGD